eukprot:6491949-Amphidinium_carterae.2
MPSELLSISSKRVRSTSSYFRSSCSGSCGRVWMNNALFVRQPVSSYVACMPLELMACASHNAVLHQCQDGLLCVILGGLCGITHEDPSDNIEDNNEGEGNEEEVCAVVDRTHLQPIKFHHVHHNASKRKCVHDSAKLPLIIETLLLATLVADLEQRLCKPVPIISPSGGHGQGAHGLEHSSKELPDMVLGWTV